MTQTFIPSQWNAEFEERLFLEVARRHAPGFPEKLTEPPREARNDAGVDAICDYYTRMASHDLFIVRWLRAQSIRYSPTIRISS